jgi:hypothetical protein
MQEFRNANLQSSKGGRRICDLFRTSDSLSFARSSVSVSCKNISISVTINNFPFYLPLHLLSVFTFFGTRDAFEANAILLDPALPFTRYLVNSRRLTLADLPSSIPVLTICREFRHESDCETWSPSPASPSKLCRHDCNRIRNAVAILCCRSIGLMQLVVL